MREGDENFAGFVRDIDQPSTSTRTPGPVGRRAAEQLKQLRHAAGMSTYDLAAALADIGWPIHAVSISRTETGQRRLTVDDVAALAVVLDTSPIRLMLGDAEPPDGEVDITPTVTRTRARAWADWAEGLPMETVGGVVQNALLSAQQDLARIRASIAREREEER